MTTIIDFIKLEDIAVGGVGGTNAACRFARSPAVAAVTAALNAASEERAVMSSAPSLE